MLLVEMPLIYTAMVRRAVMLAVPRARGEGAVASSVVTAMLLVEMPLIYTAMVRQTVMLAVPRAREEGVAGWEAETNHVIGGRDQRSEVRVVSGAGVPGVLCPLYVVDAGGVANQVGLVHVIEGAGAKATEIAQV